MILTLATVFRFWDWGHMKVMPEIVSQERVKIVIPERDGVNPISISNPLYCYTFPDPTDPKARTPIRDHHDCHWLIWVHMQFPSRKTSRSTLIDVNKALDGTK